MKPNNLLSVLLVVIIIFSFVYLNNVSASSFYLPAFVSSLAEQAKQIANPSQINDSTLGNLPATQIPSVVDKLVTGAAKAQLAAAGRSLQPLYKNSAVYAPYFVATDKQFICDDINNPSCATSYPNIKPSVLPYASTTVITADEAVRSKAIYAERSQLGSATATALTVGGDNLFFGNSADPAIKSGVLTSKYGGLGISVDSTKTDKITNKLFYVNSNGDMSTIDLDTGFTGGKVLKSDGARLYWANDDSGTFGGLEYKDLIGGIAGSAGSGLTAKSIQYINSTGTNLAQSSTFVFDGTNMGIGTSSPYGLLSIEQGTEAASLWIGNNGSTSPSFVVSGVNGIGLVGIGTSTPTAQLSISGRGTGTGRLVSIADSANSERFTLQDRGWLGLGSTSPSAKLSITASPGLTRAFAIANNSNVEVMSVLSSGSTAIGGPVAVGTSTAYAKLTIWGAATGSEHAFEVANNASTTRFFVTDTGQAAIRAGTGYISATTTSEAPLDIIAPPAGTITSYGSENPGIILDQQVNSDPINTYGPIMEFRAHDLIHTWTYGAIAGVGQSDGLFAGELSFFTQPGGSSSSGRRNEGAALVERMRINKNGYVGIGTTTPYSKLSVQATGTGSGQAFEILNSASSTKFVIHDNGFVKVAASDSLLTATTSAEAALDIAAASPGTLIADNGSEAPGLIIDQQLGGGTGRYGGTIELRSHDATDDWTGAYITVSDRSDDGLDYSGDLMFFVNSGAGGGNPSGDTTAGHRRTKRSTMAEAMRIAANGKIGIGTTTPISTLSIQGSLCVRNTGSCGSTAGTIYATTAAVTGIDLAENYQSFESGLEPGDLLAISDENKSGADFINSSEKFGVVRANKDLQGKIIGVASTKPGLNLGQSIPNSIAVALSGRVPVKVSTENGSISIGDKITISSVSGVGMKSTGADFTVGTALESYSGEPEKNGKILVFINLDRSSSGDIKISDSKFDGGITVAGEAVFDKDTVGEAKILANATEVQITFEKEYTHQPIITATPMSYVTKYKVDEVNTKGFKIKIDPSQAEDALFSWHAFSSNNGKIFVSDGSTEDIKVIIKDSSSGFVESTPKTVVVDTEAPIITLNGNATSTLKVGDSFVDQGAIVSDNVDHNLGATVTGSVDTSVAGIYTLHYNTADNAGNKASEVIRTITVE